MLKLIIPILALTTLSCQAQHAGNGQKQNEAMQFEIQKTDEEWKKILSPEQYYILRQKGTERPFTGQYNMFFENGTYHCSACQAPLFTSESKFDSHCGWPSFDKAITDSAIVEVRDTSHGMIRTEIMCAKCGGHLGHVFNDGPTETGLRYCVNSISIGFEQSEKENSKK